MTVLTIEIADNEAKFVTELLKKIDVKLKKEAVTKTPNPETIKAMEELKNGGSRKFESVKALFDTVR